MKIGLPFEAEFFPGAPPILTFDQAKRIDQVCSRRRMAAAIERIACRRKAHEIMRRPIGCGPMPLAVNGQSPMAWNEYLGAVRTVREPVRSEEHTSELQSLMRNSYAVFCLKKKK